MWSAIVEDGDRGESTLRSRFFFLLAVLFSVLLDKSENSESKLVSMGPRPRLTWGC